MVATICLELGGLLSLELLGQPVLRLLWLSVPERVLWPWRLRDDESGLGTGVSRIRKSPQSASRVPSREVEFFLRRGLIERSLLRLEDWIWSVKFKKA